MTNKTIYGCAPFASSIDNRYHYVYRITNLVEGKHYYGSRTSSILPKLDLGSNYFGTPKTDSWIIVDQQENSSHYKYKILKCFETRKEATGYEVILHKKFDLKRNRHKFYNGQNQTSAGFDTTGMQTAYNSLGQSLGLVDVKDPRWQQGEITGKNLNKVPVKDEHGNFFLVQNDDPRYLSGEFVHNTTGLVSVKDKAGNNFNTSVDDPRYLSGELVGVTAGFITAKDKDGNNLMVTTDDPRYLSGELVGVTKGFVSVKDANGVYAMVATNDPRYLSGELVGVTKGRLQLVDSLGKIYVVEKNDPRILDGTLMKKPKVTKQRKERKYRYTWVTPWGEFKSSGLAYKNSPHKNVSICHIKTYCQQNPIVKQSGSYLMTIFGLEIGQCARDAGFHIIQL